MLLTGYGDVFSADRRGDWGAAQANFGIGWLTNHSRLFFIMQVLIQGLLRP